MLVENQTLECFSSFQSYAGGFETFLHIHCYHSELLNGPPSLADLNSCSMVPRAQAVTPTT